MNKLRTWLKQHLVFHSFRVELMVYYTVFSLIVLAIGSYFSYSNIMDILRKQNERYMLQQFRQADYNINSILNDADRLSKLFIQNDEVQRIIGTSLPDGEIDAINTKNSILNRIGDFIFNYNYVRSIYLYTNSGLAIGGSATRIFCRENSNPEIAFYSSEFYKHAEEAFPKSIFYGAVGESLYNENVESSKTHLISIARSVKPVAETSKNAMIVVNMDERYIASIYSATSDVKGDIYIVNEKGEIISSGDGKNIGKTGYLASGLNTGADIGSYVYNKGTSSIQVAYYRQKSTNWYLVSEAPLSLFGQDAVTIQKIMVITFLLSILAIFFVSFLWLGKITQPLDKLSEKMHSMSSGQLGLQFSKIPRNEFGIVIRRFNEMSLSIVELIDKNNHIQEQKRNLEIEALRTQINPHFIYNTLNMIKWMAAVIRAKNIVESIMALGNILKPVFRSTEPLCTLKEEIEYLDNYIKIMNWRFESSIRFRISIDEGMKDCLLPRFVLQPVIENSITHGMKNGLSSITIDIETAIGEDHIEINIRDTGTGINPERLSEIRATLANTDMSAGNDKQVNIGLHNVNRRVKLHFGEEYGVFIDSIQGEGTCVSIHLPGHL